MKLLPLLFVLLSIGNAATTEVATQQQEEKIALASAGNASIHTQRRLKLRQFGGKVLGHDYGNNPSHHGDDPSHHGDVKKERVCMGSIGVSLMLLGAIAFNMSLFHLVNHKDPDIRHGSWKIISMTVSVFCAVLCYLSVKKLWFYLLNPQTELQQILVLFALFFFFFLILQVGLFFVKLEHSRLRIAGVGMILAHLSAFSCMNGFGVIQAMRPLVPGLWMPLWMISIAAICFGTLWCLSRLCESIRLHVAFKQHGLTDDDGFQWHTSWRNETLWLETIDEAETDMTCLSVGFLVMQTLRCTVSGGSKDVEPFHVRNVPDETAMESMMLFVAASLFMLSVFLVTWLREQKTGRHGLLSQFLKVMRDTLAMSMSWCLLYFGDGFVYSVLFRRAGSHRALG
eukprot:TRINITY_DN8757_c0_g1_i1.p1 TRINITY_DN8757_c0_g1~~TRINITY_DN8757_c0_g1_i1.p1  ORF type:complete len:398 (-),score=60.08 TRINITY_DN8757_c0_g1_i1:944-2137(-)